MELLNKFNQKETKNEPRTQLFLLQEGKVLYNNNRGYLDKKSNLKIHDDIIRYINDTLLGVPTLNPAQSQKSANYGLNLYGSTIINHEGGAIFSKIIRVWSELFSLGFVNIELTGAWTLDIDEKGTEGEGYYQKIEVSRDSLVASFTTLATYALTVYYRELFYFTYWNLKVLYVSY